MSIDVKQSFEKNGFHIFEEPVVKLEKIHDASKGMDMIRKGIYDTGNAPAEGTWNPGDDPNRLCKIEQPQIANKALGALIRSPEIGGWAAHVTGAEMVQVWWVQLLYKPPMPCNNAPPTKIGWHNDWQYWRTVWEDGSQLFTAWVALSDVVEASGPMKFVVGSHRWKDIGGGDFYSQEITCDDFNLRSGQVWQETPALMNVGGMSLHDRAILHGSVQNMSKLPRRSLAIHLRTQSSRPIGGQREGLARYIDNLDVAPIIYGEAATTSFA